VVPWAGQSVAIAVDQVLGLESFAEVLPFSETARSEYGDFGLGLLAHAGTFVPLLNMPRLVEALRHEMPGHNGGAPAEGG